MKFLKTLSESIKNIFLDSSRSQPARTENSGSSDKENNEIVKKRSRRKAMTSVISKLDIKKEEEVGQTMSPPKIRKGVVPKGKKSAIAMDASFSDFISNTEFHAFPGYQILASYTTIAEYRAFASALSSEITREWIQITSTDSEGKDTEGKIRLINQELIRINLRGVIQKCAEDDCYFGRAQIFIDLRGHDRKTPLVISPRTVQKGSLIKIIPVDASWTTPSMYNSLDPADPYFYKPEEWFMLGQEVNSSRLLTIITRPVPDLLKAAFNFGGMSLSQLAKPYVDNWLRTRQSVADLINNFSITCLATSMDQVLQGDDDGVDVLNRGTLFTKTRSNLGLMMLDKDREEMVQLNTPLSGLHELQAQSLEHMCSVSKIPAIKLTGISPSGLNASSDGEMRAWYDWVASQQESYWRDPIEKILKIVQLSLFGEIDKSLDFKFVSLHQSNTLEESQIRLNDATASQIYLGAGVIDSEEQRLSLAKNPESGYDGLDIDKQVYNPNELDLSYSNQSHGNDEETES